MQPADVQHGDVADLALHRQLVGELAEQLAHDLANRLAVARLTAEVLANRTDLPDDLAARVATVVHATSEAGDLVQQLAAVAGRRPAPPHRVDVAKVVGDLAGLLRAALGRRPLELVTRPAVAFADRRDVEEILLRLVLGGERRADDGPIALSVDHDGEHVLLVVRTGSRLPAGVVTRVAALAPLTVEVREGEQELVARFPAAEDETLEVVGAPTTGGRVLVVEDDPDLRGLVCDALRADGHTVEGAADAGLALGHRWVVDRTLELLVTDVELPGMSGLDLAAQLREAGVAVVVMSGHGEASLDGIPDGALVLDKPFGVPDLRATARKALG